MKNTKRFISILLLCALLLAALPFGLCVTPASAAGEGWKDAYRDILNEHIGESDLRLQLVDLDVDGIPELFIRPIRGTIEPTELLYAFTVKDGAIKALSWDASTDVSYYESTLYRNNRTGAYRIEGNDHAAPLGFYQYWTSWYTYALRDGMLVKEYAGFGSGKEDGIEYYTGREHTRVSEGTYNSICAAWYSGWTKVDGFQTAAVDCLTLTATEINAFLDGYKSGAVLAQASAHKLQVNGTPVSIDAYTIGGNNYFKLRDVAMLLRKTGSRFQVGYNYSSNRITLTTGEAYTATGGELAARDGLNQFGTPTASTILIDGQPADLTAYNINGNNYFKLRDLGSALGFDVDWDNATRTVGITTNEYFLEDGEYSVTLCGRDISVENGVTYLEVAVLSYFELPDAVVRNLKVGDTVNIPGRDPIKIREIEWTQSGPQYAELWVDEYEGFTYHRETNTWRYGSLAWDLAYIYESGHYKMPLSESAVIWDYSTPKSSGKTVYGDSANPFMQDKTDPVFQLKHIQDYFSYSPYLGYDRQDSTEQLSVQVKNGKITSIVIDYEPT